MRIDELDLNTRKNVIHNAKNTEWFEVWLKDNGFTYLDGGHFSSVYSNPNYGIVLKVNDRYDSSYHQFAEYCMQHARQNKYLPRIVKIVELKSRGKYLYFIEKLNKIVDANFVAKIHGAHIWMMKQMNKISFAATENDKKDFEWFMKNQPGVINAMYELATHFSYCFTDFKHENMMMRPKDGTIVIVDPIHGCQPIIVHAKKINHGVGG